MAFYTKVSAVIRNEQGSKFWDADIRVKGHENLELSNVKDLSGHQQEPLAPPQRSTAPPYMESSLTCRRYWFSACHLWAIATPQFSRT